MDINQILQTHRAALGIDMPRVVALANKNPEEVIVRDLYRTQNFSLSDFASGPFSLDEGDGCYIMCGFDEVGDCAQARISDALGTIEICTEGKSEWHAPSLGGCRFYIPK